MLLLEHMAGIIAQYPSVAHCRFSLHADVRCLERAGRKGAIRFLVETIDFRVSFCGAILCMFPQPSGNSALGDTAVQRWRCGMHKAESMGIAWNTTGWDCPTTTGRICPIAAVCKQCLHAVVKSPASSNRASAGAVTDVPA